MNNDSNLKYSYYKINRNVFLLDIVKLFPLKLKQLDPYPE